MNPFTISFQAWPHCPQKQRGTPRQLMYPALFLACLLLLNGCADTGHYRKAHSDKKEGDSCPTGKIPATQRPYTINNITYYPIPTAEGYAEIGIASWYGPDFHGKKTSNGETYDMYAMTAAHKTLPMNTVLLVKNLDNCQETIVRVNDRGPFVRERIIDLSLSAAKALHIFNDGTARVKVIAMADKAKQHSAERNDTSTYRDLRLGEFYVQIATFTDRKNALLLQKRFSDAGYPAEIMPQESSEITYYRVQVYVGKDLDKARLAEAKLAQLGYSGAFVVAR
jgi:rare lipoprotein A